MLCCPEAPNPLTDDQQVIELTADGAQHPIVRTGEKEDPLYKLFVPDEHEKLGM